MRPAQLPTLPAHLASLPEERRAELRPWLSSLPVELRRGCCVLDPGPGSAPGGYVGDWW